MKQAETNPLGDNCDAPFNGNKSIEQRGGWNHRVLAHKDGEEYYFQIHEVYYTPAWIPNGYTENGVSVGGNSICDLQWVLSKMRLCLDKPILWAGDKFPQEFTMLNSDQNVQGSDTTEAK